MKNNMLENLSLKTKLKHFLVGSLLLIAPVISQELKAQTPGINIKTVALAPEDLVRPMHSMMDRIYSIKMTGNFDKDYIAIMEEFQQGGIDLCKIYEMSGEDPKLLENAKVNALELKEDQKFLKACSNIDTKTGDTKTEPNELMPTLNKMIRSMDQRGKTGNLNKDYAAVMTLFNWANTELAKAELLYGTNYELKNRSSDIIEQFSCHENVLNEWLDKTVAEK